MDNFFMYKKAVRAMDEINRVMEGKGHTVHQIMTAILAGGHILIEDIPGVGKTTLALAFSKVLGLDYQRIQFTPDIMPTDIAGFSIYHQGSEEFEFKEGAAMTNLLLADEINRATPRTQSSLLESMEEKQITVDGTTYPLEKPFFVIATQNPVETQGTFPLPEAQLDRFIMQLSMGYTEKEDTLEILRRFVAGAPVEEIHSVCTREELLEMQESIKTVYIHPDVAAYSVDIVDKTRQRDDVALGVSPRGNLAYLRAAQALAAIRGKDYVSPDEIKELAMPVLGHRIILRSGMRNRSTQIENIIHEILNTVEVPTENWKVER